MVAIDAQKAARGGAFGQAASNAPAATDALAAQVRYLESELAKQAQEHAQALEKAEAQPADSVSYVISRQKQLDRVAILGERNR